MTHALVTMVAPLAIGRVEQAESLIDALGNPPQHHIREALERLDGSDGTHFCSLHAIRSKEIGRAYLLFELSADGTEGEAVGRVVRAIGAELETVFSLAADWPARGSIGTYLLAHRISTGAGLFEAPGLSFVGTPGMSVGRIRSEQRLALKATAALAQLGEEEAWAMERLHAVRQAVGADPELADMLETGSPLRPYAPPGIGALVAGAIPSFVAKFLWPVVLVVLLLGLHAGVMAASDVDGLWAGLATFASAAAWRIFVSSLIALGLVIAVLALGYFELRSLEERDSVDGKVADQQTLEAIFRRENHYAQNHMVSVTQRKPGGVRWVTLHLAFWLVGILATRFYRPGSLSEIKTIHFARWVTIPGTRDLVFLSNYGGSWESYLEDFITRAHGGLTAVWSNTIGFPRSENLFQKGATDGERFKRYARQSMVPTRFWYSAYPSVTTARIRTNTEIRLGLSGTQTEDEAMSWLALFGSAPRPASKLVSSEIQSLVFGGLGKDMPCGTCLMYDLPKSVEAARAWLAAILPTVGFNDGRRLKVRAITTIAFGPDGLRGLGLPPEGLESFPYAFMSGMANDSRARILGDVGQNDRNYWRWGKPTPHATLLIYGKLEEDVAALEAKLAAAAEAHQAFFVHRVPLKKVEKGQTEPFGFVDGISQPVIRGTYKAIKPADPIHLVEPGEFILGYPDNRGNTPPGPTLPAAADPRNMLPLVQATGDFSRNFVDCARDLGRNGTFLVIRELEQDKELFDGYCAAQAKQLEGRLPEPYEISREFVAAKLVGRWQNGSSLARHPYLPKEARHKDGTPNEELSNNDRGEGATERTITAAPLGDPAVRDVPRPATASRGRDNDFLFGVEDPEALRCPFGAHIRRANPRDSLVPGSQDQIDISNRHRIIRIGRQYEPEADQKPGLFFMCLNGDIERQFEFVQQTWLGSPSFHGMSDETDPLLGGAEASMGFSMPTRYGPVRLEAVPAVVKTKGGGYFFMPGKRLLEFLATPL